MGEGSDSRRDEADVGRFVERFALTMEDTGLPRMAARVFAALLASEDGKLGVADLAARLQVSPAAISGAVRYLTQVRMIARGRDPGQRRDHYLVQDDLWYEMTARRDEMLARWTKDLGSGVEAVGAGTPAGLRLDKTRRFFEFLRGQMPLLVDRWRAQGFGSSSDGAR